MRVLLSGGGTGGHIYPALAMIREIKKRKPEATFLYIGSAKGLEADIVPKAGIHFQTIQIMGFKRKLTLDNLKTIYRFWQSVQESKRMIKQFKPDIVIGTGGYVCGPVVFAASRLGIPTLIHEQNVIPGLTNTFLSHFSTAVAVSFAESCRYFKHPHVHITGNPRATEVLQADASRGRKSLGIPPHKKIVIIVGGSRGAKAINQAFLGMVEQLPALIDCHFVYVTGDIHYEEIKKQLELDRILGQVTVKPYIYNMPDLLAAASLIVNRAGASFLAEITALGIPAILIPSPYVTNNHQEKNARWLEQNGAAQVILEKDLTSERLYRAIETIITSEQTMAEMSHSSKQLGTPKAADDIYTLIHEILRES